MPQNRDEELAREIRSHLELEAEDRVADGMNTEEARYAALRAFGNVTRARETTREVWRRRWIEEAIQDLSYAIRTFRRAPGFALIATATLALAIGANTAIFSLLNALVLRDLPVRDPGSLVQVSATTRLQREADLTFPMFRELAARQRVFSGVIGAWSNPVVTINDNGIAMDGLLWAGTGNLYEELGVRPAVGRLFSASDMAVDPPAAESVAVLGYGFWQRHYRGDPSVVGRTIRVEGAPFTVIGVAPDGFTGFGLVTAPDVTIPLAATPLIAGRAISTLATSEARSVRMIGRLKPGVTHEQARAQLATAWPGAREAAMPPTYAGARRAEFLSIGLNIRSAAKGTETTLRAQYTRPLIILLALAGLVLLVACTNVASLLLSRVSVRRNEIGVRLALGSSRWRVARQLATEGVLLSVAGATVGIALSFWACARIAAIVFDELLVPVAFDGRPDMRVIGLTTAVALVAGIICSALPAWHGTRGTASDALRTEGRTVSTSGRTGRVLVGAQLALSLVLLTTAGVLVRTLVELRALNTGIERSDGVFVAYPKAVQPGAYTALDNDIYYRRVLARIEALPGVTQASVSLLKPGTGGGPRDAVVPRGGAPDTAGVDATRSPVSPGFFAAVGLRIIKGRDFDWGDNPKGRGVTILSESLARRLFGDVDPVGQRIGVGLDPSGDGLEVIGVVEDARLYDLKDPDVFATYTAALQDRNASFKCFVIRGETVSYAALQQAVEGLGVERLGDMVTLQYITDRALLLERLTAMTSSFFGSLVLLLAAVGLFGLLSQAVAQRRKEIGIRMAVGANRQRVMWHIVRDGMAVTLGGLAAGIVAALVSVRFVEALLFGVTPRDPGALAAAVAALVVTAMFACAVPALRAARVDPMTALRSE
jgi:putative ABC transport system permease protein